MTAPAGDARWAVEPREAAVTGALTRAGVYRLLATAFADPTAEALAEVARTTAALAPAPDLGPVTAEALQALGAAAAQLDAAAVAEEHGFLFDRQVRCPPYEGAYGLLDPMSAGKATALADLAGFYAAFGLGPAAARPDVEDHLATELEFLSALALKEAWAELEGRAEALAVTRDAQAAFLRDHLGRWADAFAVRLREVSPLPYYVAAAEALVAWIRFEAGRLGVVPVPLDGVAPLGPSEADAFTCPMAVPDPEADDPSPSGEPGGGAGAGPLPPGLGQRPPPPAGAGPAVGRARRE
jgi:TorA maturation chaperone TorD